MFWRGCRFEGLGRIAKRLIQIFLVAATVLILVHLVPMPAQVTSVLFDLFSAHYSEVPSGVGLQHGRAVSSSRVGIRERENRSRYGCYE